MALQRLVHFLSVLALLVAPLSLVSGAAPAMAGMSHPSASAHDESGAGTSAHCPDAATGAPGDDGGTSDSDCRTKCALSCSAVPAPGDAALEAPPAAMTAIAPRLAGQLTGIAPEAADPPPRIV